MNPVGQSEKLESSLSLVLYSLDLSVVLHTTGRKSVNLFSLSWLENKPMSLSGEKNVKDTGHARGGD